MLMVYLLILCYLANSYSYRISKVEKVLNLGPATQVSFGSRDAMQVTVQIRYEVVLVHSQLFRKRIGYVVLERECFGIQMLELKSTQYELSPRSQVYHGKCLHTGGWPVRRYPPRILELCACRSGRARFCASR